MGRVSLTAKIPDRRPVIIDLLELLSSPQCQLDYERRVPHVRVSDELLCMWFDDLYVPEDEFFKSCFSAGELKALSAFNDNYEKNEKLLPRSPNRIAVWLESDVWQGIMKQATAALAVLRSSGRETCGQ